MPQIAYTPTLWHEMFATVFNDHQPSTGPQRAARLRRLARTSWLS